VKLKIFARFEVLMVWDAAPCILVK